MYKARHWRYNESKADAPVLRCWTPDEHRHEVLKNILVTSPEDRPLEAFGTPRHSSAKPAEVDVLLQHLVRLQTVCNSALSASRILDIAGL